MRTYLRLIQVVLLALMAVSVVAIAYGQQTPSCTIIVRQGESLQLAIDNAPSGAVIELPAGTWRENIKITKPLTLKGVGGKNKTVIRSNSENVGVPVIWIATPKESVQTVSVKLEGVEVKGAFGTCQDSKGPYGILIQGQARAEISNSFIDANKLGVGITDSAQVRILRSTISYNFGTGITLRDNAHAVIAYSVVNDQDDGVELWDSSRAIISSTTISHNNDGIEIRSSAQANILHSNILDNSDSSIILGSPYQLLLQLSNSSNSSECAHVTISNSVVSGNASGGLLMLGNTATVTGSTFSNDGTGITSMAGINLSISRSTFSDNQNAMIIFNTEQLIIDNCNVSDSSVVGVLITTSPNENVMVEHNRINNNHFCGIMAFGTVTGGGSEMSGNGVDLVGDLPGELRSHLAKPSESKIIYPDPRYRSLQEAVDALLPGGELVLKAGKYEGGITIDKKMQILPVSNARVILTGGSGPALSLIRGAQLDIRGIEISGGAIGLFGGDDARATVDNCTFIGSGEEEKALEMTNSAEWVGIALYSHAQGTIKNSTISGYQAGIIVGNYAQVKLLDCTFSEGQVGVVVADSSRTTLVGDKIIKNGAYGVALDQCFSKNNGFYQLLPSKAENSFTGVVSGRANYIPGPGTPDGNKNAAVCPDDLSFLVTDKGGEFNREK